ncbi:GNAT family N-acetyltransferase [Rhodoflexus caldus]|uniref:GNAT family N-acetyltransferase n=1 Tax=Rhodoflexus caldus TaxID=2891236 RepID=UPI00202A00FA|nr:GNAT family N-acetyltransferase [Rhodoflexus caldus]
MPYTVILYSSDLREVWDEFVISARNGSFLFLRDFMEYHADRFKDYSLMIYQGHLLKAVIPANITPEGLFSHQGLTYGGFVTQKETRLCELIEMMQAVLSFLYEKSIAKWYLKLIPVMYHLYPAQEIDWILMKLKAGLYRRDTSIVISNHAEKVPYQERRIRAIKKAVKYPLRIVSGYEELEPFWNDILTPNLMERHKVAPVHSLKEIQLLAKRFPQHIMQHNVYLEDRPVAGCTMFVNKTVAHSQYISGNAEGRNTGALDYLFDKLINEVYAGYRYFNFGICNESEGQLINQGLLDWKESFGGRTIVHDFYEINTANYSLLDNCTK